MGQVYCAKMAIVDCSEDDVRTKHVDYDDAIDTDRIMYETKEEHTGVVVDNRYDDNIQDEQHENSARNGVEVENKSADATRTTATAATVVAHCLESSTAVAIHQTETELSSSSTTNITFSSCSPEQAQVVNKEKLDVTEKTSFEEEEANNVDDECWPKQTIYIEHIETSGHRSTTLPCARIISAFCVDCACQHVDYRYYSR